MDDGAKGCDWLLKFLILLAKLPKQYFLIAILISIWVEDEVAVFVRFYVCVCGFLFFLSFIYLTNLYPPYGAQTHNAEIGSRTLF